VLAIQPRVKQVEVGTVLSLAHQIKVRFADQISEMKFIVVFDVDEERMPPSSINLQAGSGVEAEAGRERRSNSAEQASAQADRPI
jgi:hypothetical protein